VKRHNHLINQALHPPAAFLTAAARAVISIAQRGVSNSARFVTAAKAAKTQQIHHPTERSQSGNFRALSDIYERWKPNTRTRTMFAVIKTGGKQYRVVADEKLRIDKVAGEPGEIIQFGEVLVVGGETPLLGTPTVAGATVAAEVLDQARGAKVIAFKKRRRKNSRRKRGHRQDFTLIRITEILTDGAKPDLTPRPKVERKPKPVVDADVSGDDDEPVRKPAAKAKSKAKAKAKAAKKPAKPAATKSSKPKAAKGKGKAKK
jgi:large subunit ribosomal protein L21